MKSVRLVMIMALLSCFFLCPHQVHVHLDAACEAEQTCADSCAGHHAEHQPAEHQHDCGQDGEHSHQYRAEKSTLGEFLQTRWICIALLILEPQPPTPIHHLNLLSFQSTHTYAVRHQHKIMLRI
ncbi:MAG: hypothetical protein FJ220_02380 [Kiritimatiellaceae bacterium]|nr:hypothetical protein [Kiritimatiellaceae bacterium]